MNVISENRKNKTLNLRIKQEDRDLIDRAAKVNGKTVTEYILDTIKRDAENTLLKHSFMVVSPEIFNAFIAKLDAPAAPNERLIKTANMKKPW
ncbi:CopG family transcriptional regulator [Photorhabdus luminescens]|uniref:type II toxin-antitoxin system TacA family antitoxin n=1 Tax=Photorhabdus akhurstii TaxID=171438 RepID=UPI000CF8677B|nr:CopG family transcriptional regulator [Photorhabdus luminescens]PQQ29819.1 CopG family transcriptional regulator [Photorhabdus luminescens]